MEHNTSPKILRLAPDSVFVSFLCPSFTFIHFYLLCLPLFSILALKGSLSDAPTAPLKPGGFFKQKLVYMGFAPKACVSLPHAPFLHHYMHRYDLSFGQAGLPGSCAYPYVPDCSARR